MLPSRKGKEREPTVVRDLQPTDLDEKLTALRRRTAGQSRHRDRDRMLQLASPPHPLPTPSSSSVTRTERSPKPAPAPAVSRPLPSSPRRHASPHVVVSRPSQDADHEDFSRRLKISSSPSPRPSHPAAHKSSPVSKLFNPDTDPIPMRRTAEPEAMSDATGSSHVSVQRAPQPAAPSHRDERGSAARQLFDHRKDDPVRFSVMSRPPVSGQGRPAPTPKSSGDYLSASSTSSYAASISSSTFTLSSTTDGSSTSSALFDGRPNHTEDAGNNVFSIQLKKLYRTISNLETKIKQEDSNDEVDDGMSARVMLKGKETETEDLEKEKWKKQIFDHKQLAETIHNLLEISLAPSVPASLRIIPTKYNMIVRLWTYAFHKLLESLRRASFCSTLALEHLQDFIYYAYTFYTGLLEEPTLNSFKSGWLEALGDLARYRMAVAAMVNGGVGGQGGLTLKAVSEATAASSARKGTDADSPGSPGSAKSVSDFPAARIDDSPSPSIGVAAARLLELEPEKERWRNVARDWYGLGLAEQPGTGKLHHHLGLLSREVDGEELRGVYHFVKSMTTLHPFPTSRESVLPIWSHAAQARRSVPDARVSELFVLLQGMLFTHIQLDDFPPTLARFIERLEIEGAEEREWIMMASINVAAVLEYGRPNGVLRKVGCVGTREANGPQVAAAMRVMAKKAAAGVPGSIPIDEERMDVDESPIAHHTEAHTHGADSEDSALLEHPPAFKYAVQLTFAMLLHVLRRPTRKASQYARSNINPYLTILLTFLSTVLKHAPTLSVLERSIPWGELATFFATIPRRIMIGQGLMSPPGAPPYVARGNVTERWAMLTSSCPPPLPEDWCLRGMEWVGRRIYERGFWKGGDERTAELEVLSAVEGGALTDGTIEDDDGDDERKAASGSGAGASDLVRRWVRIARCAVNIAGVVEGLEWTEGTRDWSVEGALAEKVGRWREEERVEREEEEARRMGRRWVDDAMDVDEEDVASVSEESEDDNENDSAEIKELKARRRYLRSLLQSSKRTTSPQRSRRPRAPRSADASRPALHIVPGYTVLVVDTNILLSSLSMVSSLIESLRWTVVVPLPVIMELDGLATNTATQLGEAAAAAMQYLSSHIRPHALSLKVQTSKGNYLTSLTVRTEEVDFAGGNAEKTMDDLILKSAIWQDDHWFDRSSMLKVNPLSPAETANAIKVVLLSLDRNLRLKARSRQLPAAGEKDLAALLAMAT
ncbi:hypothetical protein BDN70DRAFT_904058 [Pholiota conissans]|uniref:PIN domain-containing protein n=1 Tax=Pholiota conissans TaxID=109636 RepID=A0A9P6CY74_9AGAR|nr:hypothetical protein BDN70DRAFT_904058 [Pholiota conissans]